MYVCFADCAPCVLLKICHTRKTLIDKSWCTNTASTLELFPLRLYTFVNSVRLSFCSVSVPLRNNCIPQIHTQNKYTFIYIYWFWFHIATYRTGNRSAPFAARLFIPCIERRRWVLRYINCVYVSHMFAVEAANKVVVVDSTTTDTDTHI